MREFQHGRVRVPVVSYRGARYWVARQVGHALGYADDGGRLVTLVTGQGRWEEFTEGVDFIKLEGKELRQFKRLPGSDQLVGSSAARLVLLSLSGVRLAVMRAESSQEAAAFRLFLAREVMPQLDHDGRFLPQRSVVGGAVVDGRDGAELERGAAALEGVARLVALSGDLGPALLLHVKAAAARTGADLSAIERAVKRLARDLRLPVDAERRARLATALTRDENVEPAREEDERWAERRAKDAQRKRKARARSHDSESNAGEADS